MDDLREDGIRADLINDIKKTDPDFKIEANHTFANKINKLLAEEKVQDQPASNLEIDLTPQERSEQFLNEWLEKQTDIWHKRSSVRGDLFNRLYNFRNWLFGINAQTKRKLIKNRYEANMFALDAILKFCKARNIKPVIYIPPIRHDVEIPYDQVEYTSFKRRLKNLAASYNFKVLNLENAIPNSFWGTKASTTGGDGGELDFMHFQYKGHIILAKRLKEQVL
ncbi:hypothetical protein [Pontibacter fetidus]|uniref:Uncharacterized protein n=1 Tax=Pontibacter fetidus TaxID=2700082 RepID=A0A6B2GX08_9BACT|nr:hypothetical protein [Pontibacter fetidus]NDK54513.1 hypothetical protein [Pontibacter fetidus]